MAVYTLPASGTISLSDMRTDSELQLPSSAGSISMGAMRRRQQTTVGTQIPWNTDYEGTGQKGNNANIPTSGAVSLTDYYGAIGWVYCRTVADKYYYRGSDETVNDNGKDPPSYDNNRYISLYWADTEVYTSSSGSGDLEVTFSIGGYTYERYTNSVTSNYYLTTRY
jgi:hypothetical protein